MPLVTTDTTTPTVIGSRYQVRFSYQAKDRKVIGERKGGYLSKWNAQHGNRFKMESLVVSTEYLVLEGTAKTSESFKAYGLDRYWAQAEHVEGIRFYDVGVYESSGQSGTTPGGSNAGVTAPPGGGDTTAKSKPNLLLYGGIAAAVLAVILVLIFSRKG
jgi:hypothetical protein